MRVKMVIRESNNKTYTKVKDCKSVRSAKQIVRHVQKNFWEEGIQSYIENAMVCEVGKEDIDITDAVPEVADYFED